MAEFLGIIKQLEIHLRNRKWDQARIALAFAKAIQPNNPYLRAFEERIQAESTVSIN